MATGLLWIAARHGWVVGGAVHVFSPRIHGLVFSEGRLHYITDRHFFVPDSAADSVPRVQFGYEKEKANARPIWLLTEHEVAGFSYVRLGTRLCISVPLCFLMAVFGLLPLR